MNTETSTTNEGTLISTKPEIKKSHKKIRVQNKAQNKVQTKNPFETKKVAASCPLCHKSFKKSYLSIHLKYHHKPEKIKAHREDTTKVHTKGNWMLNRIAKSLTLKEYQEPYNTCKKCEKQFASEVTLVRHVREKHLGKTFQCQFCDREFTQNTRLQIHTRSIHYGNYRQHAPLPRFPRPHPHHRSLRLPPIKWSTILRWIVVGGCSQTASIGLGKCNSMNFEVMTSQNPLR